MSAPSAEVERVCGRCRLVYIEAIPPVRGWSGVCPRCGLVSDLDDTARPSDQERES
jgi:hypothetical protein